MQINSRRITRRHIWKTATVVIFALWIVVFLFYFIYMRPRHVVPILMYHYVDNDKSDKLHVTPENFARQITFLHQNNYSVISLDDLVQDIKSGKKIPPKTVVITFDDGYEDNYLYAFPFLANCNMPATMFLVSGRINTPGYVSWEQVRVMVKNDIDFGSHTKDHVYLPSVEDSVRLWDEVAGSKKDIELEAGEEVRYLCYPAGGFDEKVKEVVKKAGYEGACTTNRGSDRFNRDVFELKRIKVTNSDMNKPFHFRAKLSGYYNFFRGLRSGD